MESHPTLEELMARPARIKRHGPWNIFSGAVVIVVSLVFWLWPFVQIAQNRLPSWWIVVWIVLYPLVCYVLYRILRRLERWYWAQSWAWSKQAPH